MKRLMCRHRKLTFLFKSYGDFNNITLTLGGRYVYLCNDCGFWVYMPEWLEEGQH